MKLKKILSLLIAMAMLFSCIGITAMAEEGAVAYVAKIGDNIYVTFGEAITAANAMTGDVTVEIYGAVEFVDGMELKGNYTSITFVGTSNDAKVTINQSAGGDYLEAHGKTVTFKGLTLAKSNPAWSDNSGHMGNYFSVQGGEVTYDGCTFPNGACTSTGTATYVECTFRNTSEYGLWVYDDALVTVNGGIIDSTKGIKVYSEGEDSVTSTLTVQNATFTENVTAKPAVAIGYAESITLIGNTYNNTMGVLELDSGSDADCEGITFVAQDANGNDIASTLTAVDRSNSNAACGVLVDGKIYTTVTEAAKDAASGDTVTLLYGTTETVEFAEDVTLNKNNYEAANVTVKVATPVEVATYEELVAALAGGGNVKLTANITVDTAITVPDGTTIDLNNKTLYVNVENSYYNNATIKNGNVVLGKDDVHVCDGYFLVNEGKTLVLNGVTMTSAESGIKGYAVFHLKTGANLDLIDSNLNISNNEYSAGYIVYAGESTATIDIQGTTVVGTNTNGIVHATTVIENSTFTITDAVEHGINRSGVTIDDSTVTISGGTGRGITAQHGDLVITGESIVNISDMGEATIELRNDKSLTVAETAYVSVDAEVNNTTGGTVTGIVTIVEKVAEVNGVKYATLEEALKAATANCTITLLDNITVSEAWDCRDNGAKITVPVTIDGNGKTIKLTGAVDDKNWNTVFRLEADSTVKNLTIDISEATDVQRGVSSKYSITAENCNFIGNGTSSKRAIIFGEGAGSDIPNVTATITSCTFTNWSYGVSDNQSGKVAKSVTITDSTFNNSNVLVSASETVTFTGNTVTNGYVNIKSYTADNTCDVTATGNTLDTTKGEDNKIDAGGEIAAQDEFYIPASGVISQAYTTQETDRGRIWGSITDLNASESVVIKLYSGEKLMSTTSLTNMDYLSLSELTYNIVVGGELSGSWNTVWETGHPNELVQPDKVVLFVDGQEMNTAVVTMDSKPDSLGIVTDWTTLQGVKKAVLPNAEVTNLGMISITAEGGNGDYVFGDSYYVYDLLENQEEDLAKSTEPFDMNIAMQFVAKDSAEEAKANAYADYTTDFFIKIDGLEEGSFVGNGCYLAGYYPSFGAWVKIPLDGFTVENGKVYPVISSAGFDFSYVDICTSVEDFICGIYLTPEILEANPNISVNLALGLSESLEKAQSAEFVEVGDYTYTAEDFKEVELFPIYGMNIDLESCLVANVYVDPTYLDGEDYYAKIVHSSQNGDIEEIVDFAQWTDNNGFKCFSYSGLAAKNMADKITVTIFNGDNVAVSKTAETSLSAIALKYLEANVSDNMSAYQSAWVKAFVDMLNYGAEAQKYFDYNESNLANVNAENYKDYATQEDVTLTKDIVATDKVYSSNMDLENRIIYNAYFKDVTEDMHAEVEFTNHLGTLVKETIPYSEFVLNGGVYQVPVKSLGVADAGQLVTVIIKDAEGNVHAQLTESINGNIARTVPYVPGFEALGKAMAKFTTSAYAALHIND